MPQFFATCPQGLSYVLKEELESFGLNSKALRETERGVQFTSPWETAYLVNYKTKIASRVLKPVLTFTSSTEDQILSYVRKHDFSKYIPKGGTFSLKVKVQASSMYKDQRVVMNLIRVGLLNDFEKKGRSDIKVNKENPSLEIVVVVYHANFSISLNMSGQPLSHRGYREEALAAPLRENLAAGLVKMTGWSKTSGEPLVDFMCGSGTLLIEAARLNEHNSFKRTYSFESWTNVDKDKIKEIKSTLLAAKNDQEDTQNNSLIFGFDQDPRSIQAITKSSNDLGLNINIKQIALKDVNQSSLPKSLQNKKGIVILNPPYGKRLGTTDQAKEAYALIGQRLKAEFKGWKAFILSPEPELSKELRMKAFFKKRVNNGGVDCVLLGYSIREEDLNSEG